MLIQKNLFSIYNILIKIPKIIYILIISLVLFILSTQIVYIQNIDHHVDLSNILLQYMIQKNIQRETQNHTLNQNKIINKTQDINTSNDYTLIDDSTILHFKFGKVKQPKLSLRYTYNYSQNDLPLIIMVKNDHLIQIKQVQQSYLNQHQITYDLITIPQINVNCPLIYYFYRQDMQRNELMMQIMRKSFFELDRKFRIYQYLQNITNVNSSLDQLYLHFYYTSANQLQYLTINFFRFISIKLYPAFILKIFYSIIVIGLSIITNILMGLFLRYLIISVITLYYLVMRAIKRKQNNWIHQYMNLLSQRTHQNRLNTMKMYLFFIFSQLASPIIISFGAYCIITKILIPTFPLLNQQYLQFLQKIFLLVQIGHLIICRTRISLKYYPILSFIFNYITLLPCSLSNQPYMMIILNINMTLNILNIFIFILIQKCISQQNLQGLKGQFCPSFTKPRMLFYAGYDISWQKSIPPLWTYFTQWFDYSFFSQSQKSYLEKDYQLLYGRILGMNQRQEIPQQQQQFQESAAQFTS